MTKKSRDYESRRFGPVRIISAEGKISTLRQEQYIPMHMLPKGTLKGTDRVKSHKSQKRTVSDITGSEQSGVNYERRQRTPRSTNKLKG